MTEQIKLGLLGNGIGRSRVKSLHEYLGEQAGVPVHYELMDLAQAPEPVAIESELQRCMEAGFTGVNVTHPYKRDAFRQVHTVPGFPTGLTSVNTVMFRAGRMLADNTDYSGMYHALARNLAERPVGKVLMAGSGGVGLAIAFALLRLDAKVLYLYDTNRAAAEALCAQLEGTGLQTEVVDSLTETMQQADGLINATPLGMYQYPGTAFPEAGFGQANWAFDAVYTPQRTEFLQHCEHHDMLMVSGLQLFLYQGFDAFQRFTGIPVDVEAVVPELIRMYREV